MAKNTGLTNVLENAEKRTALRFTCKGLKANIQYKSNQNVDVEILESSLDGLSFSRKNDLGLSTQDRIGVIFFDENTRGSSPVLASVVGISRNRDNHDDNVDGITYHLKYNLPLRPESIGPFNQYLAKPQRCAQSIRQRFEFQKPLAEKDIDTLHASILNLKSCQFQLILAAIPILFGILGTIISFITVKAAQDPNRFVLFLPPTSIILSFILLAVFIQKTESIRRASAFVLLLQRYLALGSFPPCYRGWHDTYENYNHQVKHGVERSSLFYVKEFEEKNLKQRIPADAFTWFAVALFTVIPLLAMILMLFVLVTAMSNLGYTMVVIFSTMFFFLSGKWFFKKYKQLTSGERSYRYLVVLFSKIMKYAHPFDPYKNDPIIANRSV